MRTKQMKTKMNFNFDGSKVFFTSDTHFNHGNIIEYCQRPFKNVDAMNEKIINNWNSVVGEDDIVFHLGDFCLGGSAEWNKVLDRLNGHIYLTYGNHDLKNIRQGVSDRFEYVGMQMRIEIGKQKIYLNHYPFLCFEGGYKDVWQLFGHVHTRKNNTGVDAGRLQYLYPTQYDVGVDNNDFTPVSYEQVRSIIKKQIEKRKY
jgi:calcineurin-like phosphoesterase family protein